MTVKNIYAETQITNFENGLHTHLYRYARLLTGQRFISTTATKGTVVYLKAAGNLFSAGRRVAKGMNIELGLIWE